MCITPQAAKFVKKKFSERMVAFLIGLFMLAIFCSIIYNMGHMTDNLHPGYHQERYLNARGHVRTRWVPDSPDKSNNKTTPPHRRSRESYAEAGKKGGATTRAKYGLEHYRRAGQRGGTNGKGTPKMTREERERFQPNR